MDYNIFSTLTVCPNYRVHYIGHAPLSHLGEEFYDKTNLVNEVITERLRVNRHAPKVIRENYEANHVKPHELMGALIVLKHEDIRPMLKKLGVDVVYVADMICGMYQPYKNSYLFGLMQILYSAIDVDRLDFITRDNVMVGGNFLSIDLERMINSYILDENSLRIDYRGLSTIINFVNGRTSLYMWVINHHRNVLMSGLLAEFIREVKSSSDVTITHKDFIDKSLNYMFSYEGICKSYIDDHDLIRLLMRKPD